MSIEEIIHRSQQAFTQVKEYMEAMPDDSFFTRPLNKWSPAQHLLHLTISTRSATAAYALPGWMVRLIGGKPVPGYGYDELVDRYLHALSNGGKATGRYIPREISPESGKIKWLIKWDQATRLYLEALQRQRTDEKLDRYAVRHPLLGKICLRDLCYFTLYHTGHHLAIVKTEANYH